jgi:hypothetical protein
MRATAFERVAGLSAILTGILGVLYSVSFVFLQEPLYSSICLLLGGLFASVALVALYRRLSSAEPGLALWAFALGFLAAAGSFIHGSYDLANALHPPAAANLDLPFPLDPRGLLTFAVAGISVLVFSALITSSRILPVGLGYLGYLSGILLIVIYLGRLVILDAGNIAILAPAALEGLIVNPVWYIWLGIALRSGK